MSPKSPHAASPAAALAAKYEATAAAFVKEHRLPGAAVGVVHGGELAWAGGVGFADRAARRGSDSTWKPTLAPTDDPDVFMIEPGFRESGELARFERAADGRVVSLFLAVAMLQRLEPVASD